MKHSQNLFVVVVGVAAWLHSTWAFSTVMSGDLPAAQSWQGIPALLFWLLPGAAAASSIDIGLIALANKFKDAGGSRARFVTFFALSLVSYIGQLVYTLHHTSTPLSAFSIALKTVVFEALVWLLPLSLPVSLILWAWSDWSSRPVLQGSAAPVASALVPAAPDPAPQEELQIEVPEWVKSPAPVRRAKAVVSPVSLSQMSFLNEVHQ